MMKVGATGRARSFEDSTDGYSMAGELRLEIALPGVALPEAYFAARYACLRAPLGFAEGAERLADDGQAIHAWWEDADGLVLAVGRIHIIPHDSDGAQADHAGPGAATCPAFAPLASGGAALRPAVQIRQMGTRDSHRRQGLAAALVTALEGAAIAHWGARSGWLQARDAAIPLYSSEGWEIISEPYDIAGIGPHHSMWKDLAKAAEE